MALGKQAKVLTVEEQRAVIRYLQGSTRRNAKRDLVMFLLSAKAGLRAIEISHLTWSMVLDASGFVGQTIELPNRASKGKYGGRSIPLHPELRDALRELWKPSTRPDAPVIYSERGRGVQPNTVHVWFLDLYKSVGLIGCSSHSGRRTFITTAARKAAVAGGSLRDVQQMAGHSSLNTTQRYIEGDTEVKRKIVSSL